MLHFWSKDSRTWWSRKRSRRSVWSQKLWFRSKRHMSISRRWRSSRSILRSRPRWICRVGSKMPRMTLKKDCRRLSWMQVICRPSWSTARRSWKKLMRDSLLWSRSILRLGMRRKHRFSSCIRSCSRLIRSMLRSCRRLEGRRRSFRRNSM